MLDHTSDSDAVEHDGVTGEGPEPIRPIRALLRGLEALEALNRRDGLTVSEVAAATRLPRTTAYRILETLCAGGFVVRDDIDDRYRPTLRVRALAEGFADDGWIREIARPELEALCKRILWPVMLSTIDRGKLVLRVATDRLSPLALERYGPGMELPLTASAGGIMRLACASEAERDALLAQASADGVDSAEVEIAARAAREAVQRGYALDLRTVQGEASVAVPVRDRRDSVRAIVCMRFIRSALSVERVVAEFVPALLAAAETIGAVIPLETGGELGAVRRPVTTNGRANGHSRYANGANGHATNGFHGGGGDSEGANGSMAHAPRTQD